VIEIDLTLILLHINSIELNSIYFSCLISFCLFIY